MAVNDILFEPIVEGTNKSFHSASTAILTVWPQNARSVGLHRAGLLRVTNLGILADAWLNMNKPAAVGIGLLLPAKCTAALPFYDRDQYISMIAEIYFTELEVQITYNERV